MAFKLIPLKIKHSFLQIIDSRNIFISLCNLKHIKKKYLDFSKVPKLNHEDLEIQYVRGSGPGGQATNKTNNAVVIKHIPTGIVTKCHETRSQSTNQKIAEEKLINKLDLLYNKDDAVENQEKLLLKKKSNERKRRQKKRALLKEMEKKEKDILENEKKENKNEENENYLN